MNRELNPCFSIEEVLSLAEKDPKTKDSLYEGRDSMFMDIDRITNEGLAGGYVTKKNVNGAIEDTTVDTMTFPD